MSKQIRAPLSAADRFEIEDLISEYCRIVDRKAYSQFGRIFSFDITINVVIQELTFQGIASFKKFLEKTKSFSSDRMHFTSNIALRAADKGRVVGLAYWHSTATHKGVPIVEGGFYEMSFEKLGGKWKFKTMSIYHKYRTRISIDSWNTVGFPGSDSRSSKDTTIFAQLKEWF